MCGGGSAAKASRQGPNQPTGKPKPNCRHPVLHQPGGCPQRPHDQGQRYGWEDRAGATYKCNGLLGCFTNELHNNREQRALHMHTRVHAHVHAHFRRPLTSSPGTGKPCGHSSTPVHMLVHTLHTVHTIHTMLGACECAWEAMRMWEAPLLLLEGFCRARRCVVRTQLLCSASHLPFHSFVHSFMCHWCYNAHAYMLFHTRPHARSHPQTLSALPSWRWRP